MPSGLIFLFFFKFLVDNLQYGFICKYCAIDGNIKKKKRKAHDETKSANEKQLQEQQKRARSNCPGFCMKIGIILMTSA